MSARLPGVSGPAARRVKILAFGHFEVLVDGNRLRFGRKAPARPLALLKYLAAHGGEVPDVQVAGALWPGKGGTALRSLAVNVHRLRHLLGEPGALFYHDRRVAIDTHHAWCDAFAFEHWLDHAANVADEAERHRATQRALALYRGDLLAYEEPHAWIVPARQRLRTRFVRSCAALGARLAAMQRWEEAHAYYQRGLEVDELAEELCLGLMTCLAALRQPVDGVAAYRRFERSLAAGPGAAPASATRALYRQLLRQRH